MMVLCSTTIVALLAFAGDTTVVDGVRVKNSKKAVSDSATADNQDAKLQVTSWGPYAVSQPHNHTVSPAVLPLMSQMSSGPVVSEGSRGARNLGLEDAKEPAFGSRNYASPVADSVTNGANDQGGKKSLASKTKLGKTKVIQGKKAWWKFWEKTPKEDRPILERNANKQPRRFVKVRLFWVRHGLSCANVMDKCSKGPAHAEALLPIVEKALQQIPNFESAKVKRTFGLQPSTKTEGDCLVEVVAPGLVPGEASEKGAIIRLHDLYTDPALTDCARQQSTEAGRSFMKWLQRKGIKVHFTGSSFLMRALQTSYGMFREPCGNTEGLDCDAVFVGDQPLLTPVPYMTERSPPGRSAFQQDNMPMSLDKQHQTIEKIHGKKTPSGQHARRGLATVCPAV